MAYEMEYVAINASIHLPNPEKPREMIETTIGRVAFYEVLPKGFDFINETLDKSKLKKIIGRVLGQHGQAVTASFLDRLKSLGFRFVGELAQKSLEEVKALEGMKPEILVEIQRQLNYCGFQLGTVLSPDIKAIYDRELSKDRGLSERKKR